MYNYFKKLFGFSQAVWQLGVLCVVRAEAALGVILQQRKGLVFLVKSKKVRRLLMLPQPGGSKNGL